MHRIKLQGQLKILLFTQFIIIACLEMTDPFWPLILSHSHHFTSKTQLQYWSAAVYAIPLLATIIATPLWGQLGQSIGQKKMLLRASSALVVTQVLLGFINNPLLILSIRLIQGIFAGFTAAAQAWAITTTPQITHSKIIGQMQAVTAVGAIAGPIFGGMIAHYLGYNGIFFISAFFCLISTLLMAYYLQESKSSLPPQNSFKIFMLKHLPKKTQFLLLLLSITQAVKWMSSSFFALYVFEQLKGNNLTIGFLYATTATMIFITAPRWGALIQQKAYYKLTTEALFIICLIFAGVGQYLYAISTTATLAFLASLLLGVTLGAISLIPFSALVHQTEDKGSLVGLGISANKFGNLIGVTLGALMQVQINFKCSFIVIGSIYIILAAILYCSKINLSKSC